MIAKFHSNTALQVVNSTVLKALISRQNCLHMLSNDGIQILIGFNSEFLLAIDLVLLLCTTGLTSLRNSNISHA